MGFFASDTAFNFFHLLTLIGGIALFMFGMNTMGDALEKQAGGKLKPLLANMTNNPLLGFLLGMVVTAVIQSSSATTVMVVGLVSAGVMTLKQSVSVIIGANVGTTVTSWILSLTGIEGDGFFLKLLKPSSFTPVLAVIGIFLIMLSKSDKKKGVGTILIGFAVLMFGMETMSGAVAGLKEVPEFGNILLHFSNPILGVLAGAVLTAIIQSSSASVGILQALCSTGAVTYASVLPIIMGQNIGTCITALLSAMGASKDAKRASFVHLYFNLFGSIIFLAVFYLINFFFPFAFMSQAANEMGIAIIHTVFNVVTTCIMLPASGLLEKLARVTVKADREPVEFRLLDERLLASPTLALDASRRTVVDMATLSIGTMEQVIPLITNFDPEIAARVRKDEDAVDHYEDKVASYLIRLSDVPMTAEDSHNTTELLRLLGDFERISDHAVDILRAATEMQDKGLHFSDEAQKELAVLEGAVSEILSLTLRAFANRDLTAAAEVEPLEQVVDKLKEEIRKRHTQRLVDDKCTIELGFVLSDILTSLERVSDHCSNIAGCLLEMAKDDDLRLHEYLGGVKKNSDVFLSRYAYYEQKHQL